MEVVRVLQFWEREAGEWRRRPEYEVYLQYVNLQGQTWRYALWRQMYHLVNHSTYHRGQLTTMLRQLKAAPVPTDFLVFHDEFQSGPA